MALDHYVSQVHLRRFCAPDLNGRQLYAFRKSNGTSFICNTKDVCRIDEGNTNHYLPEPRLIEEFLKLVEPNYNAACEALLQHKMTTDAVFVIAGFVAYVMACSPTAMRIFTAPLERDLELQAKLLDRNGQIPRAPTELGGKTLTELLTEGTVGFDIDRKYPQAIAVKGILDRTLAYGNSHWDILINEHSDTPFFTTDFPVAVQPGVNFHSMYRVVPLTPQLAIRVRPRMELLDRKLDSDFKLFSYARLKPSRSDIVSLNRLIVRCAEEMVFSTKSEPWVPRFVQRNASFRVENEMHEVPHGNGYLSIIQTVVREQPAKPQ
ncbi:MAG: hypothetical protein QOK17_2690 [Sphingomonadales bacterium]|nr:hypothetical protein [Sphingomonadales bacterium]